MILLRDELLVCAFLERNGICLQKRFIKFCNMKVQFLLFRGEMMNHM